MIMEQSESKFNSKSAGDTVCLVNSWNTDLDLLPEPPKLSKKVPTINPKTAPGNRNKKYPRKAAIHLIMLQNLNRKYKGLMGKQSFKQC